MRYKSINNGDAEYCDARYIINWKSVMLYTGDAR